MRSANINNMKNEEMEKDMCTKKNREDGKEGGW